MLSNASHIKCKSTSINLYRFKVANCRNSRLLRKCSSERFIVIAFYCLLSPNHGCLQITIIHVDNSSMYQKIIRSIHEQYHRRYIRNIFFIKRQFRSKYFSTQHILKSAQINTETTERLTRLIRNPYTNCDNRFFSSYIDYKRNYLFFKSFRIFIAFKISVVAKQENSNLPF